MLPSSPSPNGFVAVVVTVGEANGLLATLGSSLLLDLDGPSKNGLELEAGGFPLELELGPALELELELVIGAGALNGLLAMVEAAVVEVAALTLAAAAADPFTTATAAAAAGTTALSNGFADVLALPAALSSTLSSSVSALKG